MAQVRGLSLPPDIESKFLFANARTVFRLSALPISPAVSAA
jgi:hypothetical protein